MIACGVVLAGGGSRRMGAQDKALLPFPDRPLVHHVATRLSAQSTRVAINYNGDNPTISGQIWPVIADDLAGGLGPLAGVHRAMQFAKDQGYDQVCTVSVDTPFFPDNMTGRLVQMGGFALASSQGRTHPTCGLWPVSLMASLETYLNAGHRRVMDWCRDNQPQIVSFPTLGADPFFNINTPQDYDMALQELVSK